MAFQLPLVQYQLSQETPALEYNSFSQRDDNATEFSWPLVCFHLQVRITGFSLNIP